MKTIIFLTLSIATAFSQDRTITEKVKFERAVAVAEFIRDEKSSLTNSLKWDQLAIERKMIWVAISETIELGLSPDGSILGWREISKK